MIKRTLLLFFILCLSPVFGQTDTEYLHVLHYSSDEGLPHSLVFDMAQSKDGFIWVATNNGLGRFDGYNFKTYRPQKDKPYSISSKSITKLTIGNKNNIWLGIQGYGLNRMDLISERFYSYTPDSLNPNAISGNDIRCIFQDSDSIIWVGSNQGLDFYDEAIDGFVNCFKADKNLRNTVNSIYEDVNGKIWFGTNRNIGYYNKLTQQISYVQDVFGEQWPHEIVVQNLYNDNNERLWVASLYGGLFCFNMISNKLEIHIPELKNLGVTHITPKGDMYVMSHQKTSKIIHIPDIYNNQSAYETVFDFGKPIVNYHVRFNSDLWGNLWISSEEGLIKLNSIGEIKKVQSENYTENDLLGKTPTAHFIDRMGNFWLDSQRKGIVMIDLQQKQFNTFKTLKPINEVIGGDNISMVFEDSKGRLWVGCYGVGIVCYNPKYDRYHSINYGSDNGTEMVFKAPAGIDEDVDGNIWIGFYDGGLLKIDGESFKLHYEFGTRTDINNSEYGHSIRSIFKDNKDNLWFATNSNGLIERKNKSGELIFHSELYEKEFFTNSHYRFVTQTKDGIVWTGTQNGGLGRYNIQKKEFVHFRNDQTQESSISGNTVYYVYEQSDSILWVGTDKGLSEFNRNTQQFKAFAFEDEGFMCGVYRIYPDKDDNLWLSGDCGLIKFNPLNFEYTIYEKSDGLPNNEFNTTAGCKNKLGEIFMGSSNGLLSFVPENISSNSFIAKPLLTQFKIFNQNISAGDTINGHIVLTKELSLTDHITLPHDLNDFTIEFSAMHFASPEKNKYEYKLEGFSNEWIKVDASRRWANFTGLNPGNYIFHLKASNNDGVMCDEEDNVKLVIEINPPFYQTILFRIVFFSLLLVIVILLFRFRIKNIKTQKRKLEYTVKERTGELQKQNSLLEERQEEISIQKEELIKHRNHLEDLVDTRTKKLQEALEKAEESDRLKSAFLSNMSHEIRTPMNAIIGFSSLLLESDFSDQEKVKFLEMVHLNGKTLLKLLNDIIDISLIESGQLKINNQEFDLNTLLNDISETFQNSKELVDNDDLTYQLLNHCTELITINSDAVRLKQVLDNLLNNALKFTKRGDILLSVTHTQKLLTFSVVDTGIGIKKKKQDVIFNRFQKVEDSDDELYRGGGLGLAICKNLIESMGGNIWVNSEPNIGAKFFFTIPL